MFITIEPAYQISVLTIFEAGRAYFKWLSAAQLSCSVDVNT